MKLPANWYYDEMQQVGVDYADPVEVQNYDLHMNKIRSIENEIANVKLAINLDADQTILEIGTGTGEFAVQISQYCRQVVAIDTSSAMLDFACRKAKLRGRNNIEFHNAGFLTYQHQGNPLDAVVSQLALHHLPDFWKMLALRRVYGMLKDGGKFYLRDVVFPSHVDDYISFFNQQIDNIKDAKIAEEVKVHIKEEFSTLDWIMEDLLRRAGFTVMDADYNGLLVTYLCLKAEPQARKSTITG